jgi:two-component system, NarL family, sensor histidine kinase UhpB
VTGEAVMDLKWLLVRRITLVALSCFLIGSGLALNTAARESKQQNAAMAQLAAQQLDLQLSRIDRSTDISTRFPDWDLVSSFALQPGQCVEFRGLESWRSRSSCAGFDDSKGAPQWFVALFSAFINHRLIAEIPLSYRGVNQGSITAGFDPSAIAGQAWATVAPLLGLSALLISALCLVSYLVVDRALLPTFDILEGLNRLARGDLSYRLPTFRLRELNRISEVFNSVSEELKKANSERADLARRLIDMQEHERRHLARELHDDIAQKLAALNALAACIRKSALTNAPNLVDEVRELEKMAAGSMISLRRTLTYLRPQEIDDLGLLQSLKALVERHNSEAHGQTNFTIEVTGEVEQLRAETNAHVYRIVQEALTNAAKHARARHVHVSLIRESRMDEPLISLSIVDDGVGASSTGFPRSLGGSGLIGMRERVAALSGKFAAGARPMGGFALQVEFPVAGQGA